jgi:PemK-like protein.
VKKGDIVLVSFPFTDLAGTKNRPALVLIATELDVTLCFITSQVKWQERFDLLINPTNNNGLKKSSLIRLSKITTVEKQLVLGRLGTLSNTDLENLNTNLKELFLIN